MKKIPSLPTRFSLENSVGGADCTHYPGGSVATARVLPIGITHAQEAIDDLAYSSVTNGGQPQR